MFHTVCNMAFFSGHEAVFVYSLSFSGFRRLDASSQGSVLNAHEIHIIASASFSKMSLVLLLQDLFHLYAWNSQLQTSIERAQASKLLKTSIWSHSDLFLWLLQSWGDPSRNHQHDCSSGPPPSRSVEQTDAVRRELLFTAHSKGFESFPALGTRTVCIICPRTRSVVLTYSFTLSFLVSLRSGSETFWREIAIAKGVGEFSHFL